MGICGLSELMWQAGLVAFIVCDSCHCWRYL